MIYLDNAATTKIDPQVFASMLPWLTEKYGNPGSLYDFGRDAADAVDYARYTVSRMFHCEKEQVIFTAGGSEGNNLVIKGVAPYIREAGHTTILYSAVEHDSVIHAVEDLCAKFGFQSRIIPVLQSGEIDMEALSSMLDDTVGLVSVMHTNNELGCVVWNGDIVQICHERGILVHCDCVQAAYDYDLSCNTKRSPDFAVISSHKIHGPKGVGAVYVKNPEWLSPLISGGKDQEHGLRGGTENVAGIVGFGKACVMVMDGDTDSVRREVSEYGDIFLEEFQKEYGGECRANLSGSCSKTMNICVPGVDAQSLVLASGANGVCISAGSACRSNETSPSHVLKAIGLSDEDARSSIRVSFSRMNNEYEVREGARVIARCAKLLKGVEV